MMRIRKTIPKNRTVGLRIYALVWGFGRLAEKSSGWRELKPTGMLEILGLRVQWHLLGDNGKENGNYRNYGDYTEVI